MAEHRLLTPQELGIDPTFAMPARPLRIGIVGFGSIARHAHAPAYRAMGWPIVAAADPEPSARDVAREQFGVPAVYERYEDLVIDPNVDIVDLMTQPTLREEVLRAAASAGKPLITEKPLATAVEVAERCVRIAEEANIPLAVHQNYRWMATNAMARRVIDAGWIGSPFYVGIHIYGTQDRDLASHPFYATCTDFLPVQWNNHLADLVRFWTGRDAERVWARTARMQGQNFVSDNLLCSIHEFGPGLTGHIVHHELLQSQLSSQPCRIDGDKGSLVFDLWGDRITLHSTRLGGEPCDLIVSSLGLPHSMAGSMGDFQAAIEAGREPMVSGRANLATIRTVLAELASAEQGGAWVLPAS